MGRTARLAAGAFLFLSAGRLIFVYSTTLFAEYSRYTSEPQIYLSPWDDIARFSIIGLVAVPIVLVCGTRLVGRALKSGEWPGSRLAFSADCAWLCAIVSFVQFATVPLLAGNLVNGAKDALMLSALGGGLGAWSGLAISVFVAFPNEHKRTFAFVAVSALMAAVISLWLIVRFQHNDNLQFWVWIVSPPLSVLAGTTAFRMFANRVSTYLGKC